MKAARARLTRREAALVAAALLLPVPLFAQSGLSVPLPDSVSRGLGSLVTIQVDGQSGTSATATSSENGSDTERSGHASLGTTSGTNGTTPLEDATPKASDQPAGESGSGGGTTPAGDEPEGAGGDAGPSGGPSDGPEPSDGSPPESGTSESEGSGAESTAQPGLRVSLTGQGSSGLVSAGTGDSGVDADVANADAPSDDEGTVGLEATGTDGSTTSTSVTVPGVGAPTLP